MKYNIIPTTKFKKDLKKASKRNLKIEKLEKVIDILAHEIHNDKLILILTRTGTHSDLFE